MDAVKEIKMSEKAARVFHFLAEVTGEVRKVTVVDYSFKSNDGKEVESKRLEIALDDDDEERFFLYDKDLSHAEKLDKGKVYNFKVRIDCDETFDHRNKSTKIFVTDFELKK